MTTLRDALTEIYAKHGYLTKEIVLAESTPKNAALHDRFEWDDKVGGQTNRLHQAGQLIRSVRIVYKDADEEHTDESVRAWVSYKAPEAKPVYLPTEKALADPFIRAFMLKNMQREWQALKRKYGSMAEFAAMVAEEEPKAG
jgi:hypothetical protein